MLSVFFSSLVSHILSVFLFKTLPFTDFAQPGPEGQLHRYTSMRFDLLPLNITPLTFLIIFLVTHSLAAPRSSGPGTDPPTTPSSKMSTTTKVLIGAPVVALGALALARPVARAVAKSRAKAPINWAKGKTFANNVVKVGDTQATSSKHFYKLLDQAFQDHLDEGKAAVPVTFNGQPIMSKSYMEGQAMIYREL
jgi:hypothetical protein